MIAKRGQKKKKKRKKRNMNVFVFKQLKNKTYILAYSIINAIFLSFFLSFFLKCSNCRSEVIEKEKKKNSKFANIRRWTEKFKGRKVHRMTSYLLLMTFLTNEIQAL